VALWFICSPVPVAAGIPVAAGDGDAGAVAEVVESLTHRHICRVDAETEEERGPGRVTVAVWTVVP
jgi:hypothetical protein